MTLSIREHAVFFNAFSRTRCRVPERGGISHADPSFREGNRISGPRCSDIGTELPLPLAGEGWGCFASGFSVWREPQPAAPFERVGLRASFARLDPSSGEALCDRYSTVAPGPRTRPVTVTVHTKYIVSNGPDEEPLPACAFHLVIACESRRRLVVNAQGIGFGDHRRANLLAICALPRARDYFSNPTNTVASSTDFRSDTTAFAGKFSSGQPSAMLFMMT